MTLLLRLLLQLLLVSFLPLRLAGFPRSMLSQVSPLPLASAVPAPLQTRRIYTKLPLAITPDILPEQNGRWVSTVPSLCFAKC